MHKLEAVATDLINRAARRGSAAVELARGLRLELVRTGSWYTLTLSRPAVPPSAAEIEICIHAFSIPDGATTTECGNEVTLKWPA